MKAIHTGWVFLLMLSAAGCGKPTVGLEQATARLVEAIPQDRWRELASRRIFFAHQSVGNNIIEGVSSLVLSNPQIGVRLVIGEPVSLVGFEGIVLSG